MLDQKYEYTRLQIKLKAEQSIDLDLSNVKVDLGFLGSTSSHQFQVTAYDNMNEDNPLMKFSNIFDKDFLTVDLDKS